MMKSRSVLPRADPVYSYQTNYRAYQLIEKGSRHRARLESGEQGYVFMDKLGEAGKPISSQHSLSHSPEKLQRHKKDILHIKNPM
jgi:hypothetical protein